MEYVGIFSWISSTIIKFSINPGGWVSTFVHSQRFFTLILRNSNDSYIVNLSYSYVLIYVDVLIGYICMSGGGGLHACYFVPLLKGYCCLKRDACLIIALSYSLFIV